MKGLTLNDQKNTQAPSQASSQKLSRFRQAVERGANIKINPEQKSLGELAKKSANVSPLYLPKLKFWNAPDVRSSYRSVCRLILKLWGQPSIRYLSFKEVCAQNNIEEFHLAKIESRLKLTALIAFSFIPLSVFFIVYLWTVGFLLAGLGSIVIALSLFWKYSFLLWQVRLRSLDKDTASVSKFMQQEWYLEAFK